jgi:hypothetical protein
MLGITRKLGSLEKNEVTVETPKKKRYLGGLCG